MPPEDMSSGGSNVYSAKSARPTPLTAVNVDESAPLDTPKIASQNRWLVVELYTDIFPRDSKPPYAPVLAVIQPPRGPAGQLNKVMRVF